MNGVNRCAATENTPINHEGRKLPLGPVPGAAARHPHDAEHLAHIVASLTGFGTLSEIAVQFEALVANAALTQRQ